MPQKRAALAENQWKADPQRLAGRHNWRADARSDGIHGRARKLPPAVQIIRHLPDLIKHPVNGILAECKAQGRVICVCNGVKRLAEKLWIIDLRAVPATAVAGDDIRDLCVILAKRVQPLIQRGAGEVAAKSDWAICSRDSVLSASDDCRGQNTSPRQKKHDEEAAVKLAVRQSKSQLSAQPHAQQRRDDRDAGRNP